jgi:DNA-binding protein YbaB
MTDLQQLMRLSQQLQTKMTELQESLEATTLSATSGGGMVTVTVEMLEDLVLAAVTEAQNKARGAYEQEMRKATGGLPLSIPGLPKLF